MSSHNLLKEDLKKLETKLHFLENPKIEATTDDLVLSVKTPIEIHLLQPDQSLREELGVD